MLFGAARVTYTTAEVAVRLNLSPSRVRRLAAARNVGTKHGRDWHFTEADVSAMRVRVTGRPPQRKAVDGTLDR